MSRHREIFFRAPSSLKTICYQGFCRLEFLFLAANIDAVETAEYIGIRAERAANYSLRKTEKMYDVLSDAICYSRINREIASDWSKDIKVGVVEEEQK